MKFRFATYDVFTETRFAGNPLAVVFEADALNDTQMQAIAREFNLSETIFIRTSADTHYTASVRIFTPARELPFAGHPTIGGAIAVAEDRHGRSAPRDLLLVLEEKVGPVRCGVRIATDGASFAEFSVPQLATPFADDPSVDVAAQAVGVAPDDIGFDAHAPTRFTAGVPYTMIPVASLDVLARVNPTHNYSALGFDALFVYARAERDAPHAFRARMFAPEIGIVEDPATGSAAAAFAGVAARFEDLPDGWNTLPILQGVEMGRPSLIGLEVNIEGGGLAGARIAGKAVKVTEGTIEI